MLDSSTYLLETARSLVLNPKDPPTWSILAGHSRTVSDSIKSLITSIRSVINPEDCKPLPRQDYPQSKFTIVYLQSRVYKPAELPSCVVIEELERAAVDLEQVFSHVSVVIIISIKDPILQSSCISACLSTVVFSFFCKIKVILITLMSDVSITQPDTL